MSMLMSITSHHKAAISIAWWAIEASKGNQSQDSWCMFITWANISFGKLDFFGLEFNLEPRCRCRASRWLQVSKEPHTLPASFVEDRRGVDCNRILCLTIGDWGRLMIGCKSLQPTVQENGSSAVRSCSTPASHSEMCSYLVLNELRQKTTNSYA